MIYIDYREPKNIEALISSYNIPTKRIKLNLGDYVFGIVCVERKTAGDFLSSIYQKRLFKQLHKMRLLCDKPILIIQGNIPTYRIIRIKRKFMRIDLSNREIKNRRKIVNANLALAYISYNIPFYWAKDETELVEFLVQLYLKSDNKKQTKLIPLKDIRKVTSTIPEIKVAMLGCIPNLGRKLANTLAELYSIKELSNMDIKELEKIKGIGEETARKIVETLST